MTPEVRKPKRVGPVRLSNDADTALARILGAFPVKPDKIDVLSQMVLWLERQPQEVREAVLMVGRGGAIPDPYAARAGAYFGEEDRSRASSSGPQQSGRRARPAA